MAKIKCPLCHTYNDHLVGRCICGMYLDSITSETWKEQKYLDQHDRWEQGLLGYNLIYSRLAELKKYFDSDKKIHSMDEQLQRKHENRNGDWQWFLEFAGIEQSHNYYVYHLISRIISNNKLDRIIEIGTYKGAMSICLALNAERCYADIFSFDIYDHRTEATKRLFDTVGITFYNKDAFEYREIIFDAIKDKRTWVICDGGNKLEEFLMIVPKLTSGSLVSVHDYSIEFKVGAEEIYKDILEPVEPQEWLNHNAQFATWRKL